MARRSGGRSRGSSGRRSRSEYLSIRTAGSAADIEDVGCPDFVTAAARTESTLSCCPAPPALRIAPGHPNRSLPASRRFTRACDHTGVAVAIASNLRKEFAGDVLFDGVSFKHERRDRLALAGPNGAGQGDAPADAHGRDVDRGWRAHPRRARVSPSTTSGRPSTGADAARMRPLGRLGPARHRG